MLTVHSPEGTAEHCFVLLSGDDDDDGENEDEEKSEGEKEVDETKKVPSLGDYVLHILSLFWKILFAFVPPTGNVICRYRRLVIFT